MISDFTKAQIMGGMRRARFAALVGEDGKEIVGQGYARASVSFGVTPAGLANAGPVVWPVAPVPWGVAVSVALFDEAGNFLVSDPLAAPVEIRANDQYVLPPGAIAVEFEIPEEIPA